MSAEKSTGHLMCTSREYTNSACASKAITKVPTIAILVGSCAESKQTVYTRMDLEKALSPAELTQPVSSGKSPANLCMWR